MKRFFIRAAIVISVLLIIFMGFSLYRDYSSYNNVIHKDADKVVKIRIDAIGKSIFYNAMKHPLSYFENAKKDTDTIKDEEKKSKGFGIPANIFLYTLKHKNASTIFSSFKISDAKVFKEWLQNDYHITDAYQIKGIKVAKNKDGKLIVAYNNQQCVMVYNPNKENVDTVFTDILTDDKTLKNNVALFSKLKDAEAHISYVSVEDHISINFSDGLATITGNMKLPEHLQIPDSKEMPQFSEESSLRFYLNTYNPKHQEPINFRDFTIEPDSINAYYKGNLSIEIAGATTQQDSIVTYDYNDDFEKVETQTLSTKEVPKINIRLSAKSKELLDYLENASITNNGMLNKELFPLYQFKIDTTTNVLQASTNLSKTIPTKSTTFSDCFALDIDFEKLQQQNHFPLITPFLEKLVDLKLKGNKIKTRTIKIEGHINLKNEEIHPIAQLLF